MKGFNDVETKELIEMGKDAKRRGRSLSKVFEEFAEKHHRAKDSVRNYYYKTVGEKDEKLINKLEISEELKPSFIKEFTYQESKSLIKEVLIALTNGSSVRRAVCVLANGNEKLALRYQNKYRNALLHNKELVTEVIKEVVAQRGECFNPYKQKYEKNFEKLESEINGLLLRIHDSYQTENEKIKLKLALALKENEKLKNIIKNDIKSKNLTKEFFNEIKSKIN